MKSPLITSLRKQTPISKKRPELANWRSIPYMTSINKFYIYEKLKKSAVQLVKVFQLLSGQSNKTNNDLGVKIRVNYLLEIINLF